MANKNIRCALLVGGIKQYQLAAALGMSESGLSRKLRTELPEQEQERILAVIAQLKREVC